MIRAALLFLLLVGCTDTIIQDSKEWDKFIKERRPARLCPGGYTVWEWRGSHYLESNRKQPIAVPLDKFC